MSPLLLLCDLRRPLLSLLFCLPSFVPVLFKLRFQQSEALFMIIDIAGLPISAFLAGEIFATREVIISPRYRCISGILPRFLLQRPDMCQFRAFYARTHILSCLLYTSDAADDL